MSVSTEPTIAPGVYTIDPAHTEISFRVRHLLTRVTGHFRKFSGTIRVAADAAQSHVDFQIEAVSVDTAADDRDAHLRSADFFHVETFPLITFKSERIRPASAGSFIVTGPLTIRGVSKTIDLPVTYLGTMNDPWGNAKAGFEASFRLNRKEFGLMWNAALETGGFLVGDDVDVTLNVQAALAK